MQILLWSIFLVVMWNWIVGKKKLTAAGETLALLLSLRQWAVLHEVRPYSGEGLSHDNYANNRRKVWRNGKLFVSLRKLLRNSELWQIITIYHIS